jgi:hypothetical protein
MRLIRINGTNSYVCRRQYTVAGLWRHFGPEVSLIPRPRSASGWIQSLSSPPPSHCLAVPGGRPGTPRAPHPADHRGVLLRACRICSGGRVQVTDGCRRGPPLDPRHRDRFTEPGGHAGPVIPIAQGRPRARFPDRSRRLQADAAVHLSVSGSAGGPPAQQHPGMVAG